MSLLAVRAGHSLAYTGVEGCGLDTMIIDKNL